MAVVMGFLCKKILFRGVLLLNEERYFWKMGLGCKSCCKLYRVLTDPSRGAVDHDLLTALNISFPQLVQCCSCADCNGGTLLILHIDRLFRNPSSFRQTFIFGRGTAHFAVVRKL